MKGERYANSGLKNHIAVWVQKFLLNYGPNCSQGRLEIIVLSCFQPTGVLFCTCDQLKYQQIAKKKCLLTNCLCPLDKLPAPPWRHVPWACWPPSPGPGSRTGLCSESPTKLPGGAGRSDRLSYFLLGTLGHLTFSLWDLEKARGCSTNSFVIHWLTGWLTK